VLKFGVAATFVIELVLAFFVFLPRNPRLVAAAGFIFLEVLILLTGSYNFFNLLTIVLCIALLDDGIVRRPRARSVLAGPHRITRVLAGVVVVLGLIQVSATLTRRPGPEIARLLQPWMLANSYGLFAVMTTDRHELIIEGSMDGQTWRAYEFPFKPGRLDQAPRLAAPHQPRVDWQMWFAALTRPEHARWVYNFAIALLQANPTVLELVDDPFDGEPPQQVRILSYRYRFTTPHERASDDNWWQREPPEIWMGPIRLRLGGLGGLGGLGSLRDGPTSAP
jgi:hypothetical protein